MIGIVELERILEKATAGADSLEEQLEAWDIDMDAYAALLQQWSEHAAMRMTGLPLQAAIGVGVNAGFEMGYLARLEVEMQNEVITALPEDDVPVTFVKEFPPYPGDAPGATGCTDDGIESGDIERANLPTTWCGLCLCSRYPNPPRPSGGPHTNPLCPYAKMVDSGPEDA